MSGKSIKEKVRDVHAAVVVAKALGSEQLGIDIGKAAEEAILEGMKQGGKWEAYMALFADSDEQLRRLTTTDLDGDDEWLPRAKAYLVSNAICAPFTEVKTDNGLNALQGGDFDAPKEGGVALDTTPSEAVKGKRAVKVPTLQELLNP